MPLFVSTFFISRDLVAVTASVGLGLLLLLPEDLEEVLVLVLDVCHLVLQPSVLNLDLWLDLVALHVLNDDCLLLVDLPKLGVLNEEILDL